jgi:two-component system, OmpR family, response regulator
VLIGVCEDDPAIRSLLREAFDLAGHRVVLAHNGAEALRTLGVDSGVDVIIMDIGLPDSDGRDVCQALRSAGQTAPTLFLTALNAVHDRLAGFGAGADDYVGKPFELKELIARVEAIGRRARITATGTGELTLDPATHSVRTGTGEASLTPTEFRILAAITSRPGEVVRRKSVIAAAWPDGAAVSENTLDSFIRRIRKKLEAVDSGTGIETVRGVGFRVR